MISIGVSDPRSLGSDVDGTLTDEGSFPMSVLHLLVVAIIGMCALGGLRLLRVHLGRTPHPEGAARWPFILAFVCGPPIVLGAVIAPAGASTLLGGLTSVPLYGIMLAGLAILMVLVAAAVGPVAPGRARPILKLALIGSEGDPYDVPFDPPMTARLAGTVALVDAANAAFPRGHAFPLQVDRSDFRVDWDALDAITRTLEGRIADDHRLGVAIASTVLGTAEDARSRLDTLHRLALARGQAWAS